MRLLTMRAALALCVLFSASLFAQQSLPPEIGLGKAWLKAQLQSGGEVSASAVRVATEAQTEAEVIETLAFFDEPDPALIQFHQQRLIDQGVEHLSRQIIALGRARKPTSQLLTALRSRQNADGGFGGSAARGSTVLDTSFALLALRVAGVVDGPELSRGLNYLIGRIASPNQRDWQTSSAAEPYNAAYALLALQVHSARFPLASVIESQRQRLLAQQDQGQYGEVLLDTVAALALQYASTDLAGLDSLKAAIRGAQESNGSWQNDAFLTAMALRALSIGVIAPPDVDARLLVKVRDAQSLAFLSGVSLEIGERPDLVIRSGVDGTLDTGVLPPGTYSLRLRKDGFQNRDLGALTLAAGQTRDLGVIDLARDSTLSSLSGVVTDVSTGNPIAGASVQVTGAQADTVTTRPDGSYEVRFNGAGTIVITVTATGFQTANGSGSLILGQSLRFSPALYPDGAAVPAQAAIKAQVIHSLTGAPVSGALLRIGALQVSAGSDGRLSLAELPVGAFNASIEKAGYLNASVTGLLSAGVNDLGVIRLQPATVQTVSSLSGRVIDSETGEPLPNAAVTIAGSNLRAITSPIGQYRIDGITQLPITATATAAGYGSQTSLTDSVLHSDYIGNFSLQRQLQTDLNVTIDGIAMSAPAYVPYSEVGVLATVTNRSAEQPIDLVFNAIVSDSQGNIVRDVPHIKIVFGMSSSDAVVRLAANETRNITITWGNSDDRAGDYGVRFRATTPDGRVAAERSISYLVPSAQILGGGIASNPPILQAGTGTPVALTAVVANQGNEDIPASSGRLEIKMVAADDRPPVPPKATIGPDILVGTPLREPVGIATDSNGVMYTLNNASPTQLIRIGTNGVGTVVRALPTTSPTNKSLQNPLWLSWREPNLIKVATSSGWTYDIDLNNANTVGNFRAPPSEVPAIAAYEWDARTGDEYFAKTLGNGEQIIKRTTAGQVSVAIDAGLGRAIDAELGPDGNIYVLSSSPCTVAKVEPESGTSAAYWNVTQGCAAMAIDQQGTVHIATGSQVLRKFVNGTTDVLTSFSGLTLKDLKFGNDQVLYGLTSTNTIRRITGGGVGDVVAQSLMSGVNGFAMDATGGFHVYSQNAMRYRASSGAVSNLNVSNVNMTDVAAASTPGVALAVRLAGGVYRVSQSAPQFIVPAAAGTYTAIAQSGGTIWLQGLSGDRQALFTVPEAGGTPTRVYHSPFTQNGVDIESMPSGALLVINSTSLVQLNADGSAQTIGQVPSDIYAANVSRDGAVIWVNASDGFYRVVVATGVATRLRAFVGNMRNGLVEDAEGKIVFADSSGRKFQRYDPVANTLVDYAMPPPGTLSPRDAMIAGNGDLIAYLSDRSVRRLSGGTWQTIEATAIGLMQSADRRVGYLKDRSFYEIAASAGSPPRLLATMSSALSLGAWVDDQNFADYRAGEAKLVFLNAASQVVSTVFGLNSPADIAVSDSQKVYTLDASDFIQVLENGTLRRIGTFSDASKLEADHDTLYLLTGSGIMRVNADGTTTTALTIPGWALGEYVGFDAVGQQFVVQRSQNRETLVVQNGVVTARYFPLGEATDILQRANGNWLIANPSNTLEFDPVTQQAWGLSSDYGAVDMTLDHSGRLVAVNNQDAISAYSPSAGFAEISAVTPGTFGARFVGVVEANSGKFYAVSDAGMLYVADRGELQFLTGGVRGVVSMRWHDDTGLLLASSSGGVYQLKDSSFRVLTQLPDQLFAICALDADTFAVSGRQYMFVMNPQGTYSLTTLAGKFGSSMKCETAGSLLAVSKDSDAIFRASAGPQQVGAQVGDVLKDEIISIPALAVSGQASLDLGEWLPPVGGDYEISLTPLTSGIEGRLLTGLHVGPAANAILLVSPDRVTPGTASVAIKVRIEGADFTHISRPERTLMQAMGDGFYPDQMAMDPEGLLWFGGGNQGLRRKALGSNELATVITSGRTIWGKGEIPIDRNGRAYAVLRGTESAPTTGDFQLFRFDKTGASEWFANLGPSEIVSLTIDNQDVIYALTANSKVLRVFPDGTLEPYVTIADTQPYGITRDGVGGLYLQFAGTKIYYVDTSRQVRLLDIRGATFEREGVSIAGDCGEGLHMAPYSMPGTTQTGEEKTLVYLVGRTGELGAILNTASISSQLDDVDFIVYDRFASRIVLMSDLNPYPGGVYHSMPVTCGAISVDLHVQMAADQTFDVADLPPSSVIDQPDGSKELIWNLRDVNRQGIDIQIQSRLLSLRRNTSRPAAQAAWLMITNTFQPEPVRLNIDVPTVSVASLASITVALDRTSYPAQTDVLSEIRIENQDAVTKVADLSIAVLDSAGNVVAQLIERSLTLGPNESIDLYPPFNTGAILPGTYTLRAELVDSDGEVAASGEREFDVDAGTGASTRIAVAVAADKPSYQSGETAQVTATVQNLLANQPLSDLSATLSIFDANDLSVFSSALPIANLAALSEVRLNYPVSLSSWAAGSYRVALIIRQGTATDVLGQAETNFAVSSLSGVTSLSGSIGVSSNVIRRGNNQVITAELSNRSQQFEVDVVNTIKVLDPSSLAVVAAWSEAQVIAAGANISREVVLNTANLALRDYLVTLTARVGTDERVLAQSVFDVKDVAFAGTLSVTPSAISPGQTAVVSGEVRNTGNLSATNASLVARLYAVPGQTVLQEWRSDVTVPAGGAATLNASLDSEGLPLGDYQVRFVVIDESVEVPLATANLRIQDRRVSGLLDANPGEVARGQPVSLTGTVHNTGNIETGPLPLRIEVIRSDTQSIVSDFSEVGNVLAGQSYQMARTLITTDLSPGDYRARFSAQVNGAWQELAEDSFKVVVSVDVAIEMSLPRDARVLVLLSCSQQQAQATGVSGAHAQTLCEQQRQAFLSAYLSERGIEHKIVLDQDSFMRDLRCGHYNVFWFSGGAVKLGVAQANEVRESVFRGDGVIVEGENDQRNSQFDEMLGHNYRGHHAGSDFPVTGSGAVFPQAPRPSYGRALKLELSSGRVEAQFNTLGWPAIVSAVYGQGRSLSYAFDLVESLRRDGADPASERLLMNGLLHVTPILAPADYVVGAYVPVTTTVTNHGAALDARLRTSVDAPAVIVSSDPLPGSGDVRQSIWDFRLLEHAQKSFDANLVTGGASPTIARSELFERQGSTVNSLSNAQVALATRDAAQVAASLLASLRAASLSGGENAARNRAVSAIESARSLEGQGNTSSAIAKWLDAADEVRRISSVSHAEWRLAIARLLAVTQHMGCAQAAKLCGTSPNAPEPFDALAFRELSILTRVQSGGSTDWEWQLAGKDAAVPSLRLNLDWRKNEAVDFVLTVDAQGTGLLQLKQAGVVKASASTDVAQHGALQIGDALQLLTRASSDVGTAKVMLRNLKLNDQGLAQTLQSATAGAYSETSLSLFKPSPGQTLKLEGTVEMGFQGNSLPQGSRLELLVKAGQLQCNGGAQ